MSGGFQRVVAKQAGGIEQLAVESVATLPEPGPGQVRVKVLAAGTGFTDTIIREGRYPGVSYRYPLTLGYDWFGLIDAVGAGVVGLQVGQAVADMPVIGGYSQYLLADAARVVPAPEGLDPAEAVCMVLPYVTAYQMLTRLRTLPRGSTCLVHAAGGAVGTALLELGRELGLRMIGTASRGKHALLHTLGAEPIDYRQEAVVERVLALTDGAGVDAVFDTLGGDSWTRSYRCLKRGGLLVGFGALRLSTGEASLPSVLWGFIKLLGLYKLLPDGRQTLFYNIQTQRERDPDAFREDLQTLFAWLKQGRLKPVVAGRLPLQQAAQAHQAIAQAQPLGRLVLMPHQ